MSAIKNWAYDEIWNLNDAGYSHEEIAKELDCDILFVKAILGGDEE